MSPNPKNSWGLGPPLWGLVRLAALGGRSGGPAAARHDGSDEPWDRETGVCEIVSLPSFRIGNQNYNFNFGFWPVSGRTWPRDPFNRVGLEKWYINHPTLAPGTNSKAASHN